MPVVGYSWLWARVFHNIASYTQCDPNVVTPLGCLTITNLCLDVGQPRWPELRSAQHHEASGVYHQELLLTAVYWSAQFGDLKINLAPWYDVLWRYANWDKLLGITFKWHSCNLRVAFQKRFLNNGSRSAYVNQNCKNSFSFSLLWIGRLLA